MLLLLVDDAAGPLVLAAALVAEDAAAEAAWLGWDEDEEEWVLLSMALGWCRGHHRGSFAMVPTNVLQVTTTYSLPTLMYVYILVCR